MSLRPVLVALLFVTVTGTAGAAEPTFAQLDGERVSLSARTGTPVLLNFWATWCGPCRAEMPELNRLHADYAARGLRVIGASANGLNERATVEAAMKRMDMSFEVWLWANANDMEHYGVGPQLPASLLIDHRGGVVARYQGVIRADRLRPAIEKLLEATPATEPAAPAPR